MCQDEDYAEDVARIARSEIMKRVLHIIESTPVIEHPYKTYVEAVARELSQTRWSSSIDELAASFAVEEAFTEISLYLRIVEHDEDPS